MVLFRRRMQLQELAEAEERGASFWKNEFDEESLARMSLMCSRVLGDSRNRVYLAAGKLILESEGIYSLVDSDFRAEADFHCYTFEQTEDPTKTVTGLEAIMCVAAEWDRGNPWTRFFPTIKSELRRLLREDRMAWVLADNGEISPASSQVLFENVLDPVSRLLRSASADWEPVENAFSDALLQLVDGNPDNAITDAGTALQLALEAKGFQGNALGPLIKDAKSKGLFVRHDERLVEGFQKWFDWASANRSERGDGHKVSDATEADAWLMVHIVGSVIVWLHEN